MVPDMASQNAPLNDVPFEQQAPTEGMTSLEKLLAGTRPDRANFVVFGPKSNCTLELCDLEWSVYQYRPSLPANILFLVLFAAALVLHMYLGFRWRSWWFMAFMIAGCVSEMIGYAGRIKMYDNPFAFPAFMIQIVFITGAPVYYTAAIYLTLSKT